MSKNTKIILGILGSLGGAVLLCIALFAGFTAFANWQNQRSLAEMFVKDPAIIAQMADNMADYDLPLYYENALILKMGTTNALYILATEEAPDHLSYPRITLTQFPPEKYANALAVREKIRQAGPQFETEDGLVLSTDEIATVVRGQDVGFTIYYWVGDTSEEHRTMISDIFAGKEGFLQLAIEGPARGWDEEMIDRFIQSVR